MSCLKHFPGEPGHCGGGEPVQSLDSQCCSAGLQRWAFIVPGFGVGLERVFSSERGEKFFSENAASSSRSDRPPVPPPRV